MDENKKRLVDYAKNNHIVKTEEDLDRRLAIIPEMSRKIIEIRWGINGGTYCHKFENLDKVLETDNSKRLYDNAMKDLRRAIFAEIIADREEIGNWDIICGLGLLATMSCSKDYHIVPETLKIPVKEIGGLGTFKLRYEDAADAIGLNMIQGAKVMEVVDKLRVNQKTVITLRWGLDGKGCKSIQEIADVMGETKKSVSHIEWGAISLFKSECFAEFFYIPYIQGEGMNVTAEKAIEIPEGRLEDEDFIFSVRTYNCLKRAGIKTVEDIPEEVEYLIRGRNFGIKSAKEVIDLLRSERMASIDCEEAKYLLEEYIRTGKKRNE